MENNSDKAMRDKLNSIEFPFDPKAWEQMEAKLDEQRKPKPLFWWWFGGIAASLLLTMGIYGYHQLGSSVSPNNTALAVNKNEETNNESPSNLKSESSAQNSNSPSGNRAASGIENNSTAKNGQVLNAKEAIKNRQSKQGRTAIDKQPSTKTGEGTSTIMAKANNETKSGKEGNGRKSKNQLGGGNPQRASNSPLGNSLTSNGANTNEMLAQNSSEGVREKMIDPISLEPVSAYLFPNDKENADDMTKKNESEDVNLKKLNKKIFNYSLGVTANITGATLGHQTGAADAFDNTPSYMAGFTQDFMFFKRFAITNSILFSQTSFTVVNQYSSKITEMAIPIGLKGYLISKPKFRFYLNAGVINHIKLRETFTYQYNLANNYTGSLNLPSTLGINSITNAYNPASELSINQSKRFYTSFYSAVGAEYIIHKHIVFFAEPLFYMALQKTGTQDKYKYNLGLSGGIRYQF